MLQQTQVATVLPYYERWMARFPTAKSLAIADDEEIMAHWQGLGYYRRCRMLVAGVRSLVDHAWPRSRAEWQSLPGVGPYTGAAIASICLGERAAVVDGNVERVFARVTASDSTGSRRRKEAAVWAGSLIAEDDPAEWNQAIMELGATVCRPRRPFCGQCPLADWCVALKTGRVEDLPIPNPRPASSGVAKPVVVAMAGNACAVVRALEGEWWAGLWRFPFPEELPPDGGEPVGVIEHTITRYRLTIPVFVRFVERSDAFRWVDSECLGSLPMPSAMRKVWLLASEYTARQCC